MSPVPATVKRPRPATVARQSRSVDEDTLHRAVILHLIRRSAANVVWLHPPNGGSRHPIEAARLKAMGVRAGAPDLLLFAGGKAYALELKADAGRISPEQQRCIADLDLAGVTVAVAYGLDAALAQLEAWGLLRRALG